MVKGKEKWRGERERESKRQTGQTYIQRRSYKRKHNEDLDYFVELSEYITAGKYVYSYTYEAIETQITGLIITRLQKQCV